MRKLFCKPKDRVATEYKNNIFYEIDCSNCEAVYFGKSTRSLKSRSDKHERPFRNCDCDKNEIAKHCWETDYNFNWDQKKVIDRESRLIPRKIKETIHSLKNPKRINKISYLLTHSWTGGKGSFEQVKCSFRVFFMKTEQASINFDTDCSYYENTLEELLFFICSLNGAERGEKRAVTC